MIYIKTAPYSKLFPENFLFYLHEGKCFIRIPFSVGKVDWFLSDLNLQKPITYGHLRNKSLEVLEIIADYLMINDLSEEAEKVKDHIKFLQHWRIDIPQS